MNKSKKRVKIGSSTFFKSDEIRGNIGKKNAIKLTARSNTDTAESNIRDQKQVCIFPYILK